MTLLTIKFKHDFPNVIRFSDVPRSFIVYLVSVIMISGNLNNAHFILVHTRFSAFFWVAEVVYCSTVLNRFLKTRPFPLSTKLDKSKYWFSCLGYDRLKIDSRLRVLVVRVQPTVPKSQFLIPLVHYQTDANTKRKCERVKFAVTKCVTFWIVEKCTRITWMILADSQAFPLLHNHKSYLFCIFLFWRLLQFPLLCLCFCAANDFFVTDISLLMLVLKTFVLFSARNQICDCDNIWSRTWHIHSFLWKLLKSNFSNKSECFYIQSASQGDIITLFTDLRVHTVPPSHRRASNVTNSASMQTLASQSSS